MSSRTYEKEEKEVYVEDYKNSGEPLRSYLLEKEIHETTLRGWGKENKYLTFGAIELKENFDKKLLKRIVEVLKYDK